MSVKISIDREKIAEFCRARQVTEIALFGSVLNDDFDSDSDVDVLVEFEPERVIGFIGLAELQFELSEVIGHKVDLLTPASLSRYFRREVLDMAEVQYASVTADLPPLVEKLEGILPPEELDRLA